MVSIVEGFCERILASMTELRQVAFFEFISSVSLRAFGP